MNPEQFATGEYKQVPEVSLSDSPAPVLFKDVLYVLHQGPGNNGQLCYSTSSDGSKTWARDQRISNFSMVASPSGVVFRDKLYVFYNRSAIYYTTTAAANSTEWTAEQYIPNGSLSESPSAVVFRDKLYVFLQGANHNGKVYYVTSSDGRAWSAYTQMTNVAMSASPSAVVFGDKLYLFYQGHKDNGELWCHVFDGLYWAPIKRMTQAVHVHGSPSAAVFAGSQICVFHRSGSQIWYTTTSDGTTWTVDMSISGPTISASPAAIECMGKLGVFYQGGGNSGQLWKYLHESLEIVDVVYDLDKGKVTDVITTPIWTREIINQSESEQTNSVLLSKEVTETSHFENSATSSTTVEKGAHFTAQIPRVKSEAGASFQLGLTESQTNSYGEISNISKKYEDTVDVRVRPHTKMIVTFSVSECILDVPYTMIFRSKEGKETSCQGTWKGLTSWNLQVTYAESPL
jgi:hypothetical protein